MKTLLRTLLSAASLALLAPALLADLTGMDTRTDVKSPAVQFPSGSGSGAGFWIAPTDVNGFASAKLYDASGVHRYSIRSTLVYFVPSGGGKDTQGGFFGVLLDADPSGSLRQVAEIEGTWVHRADGSAHFHAGIVNRAGDGTTVSIGQVAGRMQAPSAPPSKIEPNKPTLRARLAMNWTISE